MLKKPENSAHQLPKVILFSFVVINLIVAAFIAPDFGVSIGIMDNTEDGETMYVINDLLSIITRHLSTD